MAQDFFLSGVKVSPRHTECAYNAGCCFFYQRKFKNALKWFQFACQLDPTAFDSNFGKALCLLKLDQPNEAYQVINNSKLLLKPGVLEV